MQDTVPGFKVKVKFGNSELDETIRIDTEKGTETFHITSGALDTSTGAADVVYDFKQVSIARQFFFSVPKDFILRREKK